MQRRLFATVSFLVAAATLAAGQTAPPPAGQPPPQQAAQQQQQPPTFRARVDTISVDVTVVDKQGRPVTDLTVDEFEVRESNRPQTIDTFRLITADPIKETEVSERQITSFADHRKETENPENRLLVIFLDDYHVRQGNAMAMRPQLARFVNQLGPRDLVAVIYPLTPISALTFSRNHEGTAGAMMNFEGRKYDYTPKNDYERQFDMLPPETIEQARNELTIRSLASACIYLGSVREGRKSILFVSEGMNALMPVGARTTGSIRPSFGSDTSTSQAFFAQADLVSRMRDIFSAAARNNTSVFTLDPRGLAVNEFGAGDNVSMDADRRQLNEAVDSLRIIADQTDGRAIVSTNNPLPELRKMVQELSSYYLLSYTSSVAPRDGKFHPIQVRVKRRDVEVRARKGYWAYTEEEVRRATAPPRAGPPPEIGSALEELAGIVEPSSRRPVTLWIGATRGSSEKARITVAWEALAPAGQDPLDKVAQVALTATSGGGDVVFQGPATPDTSAGRLAGRVSFEAPAGLLKLRATAQNSSGHRLDAEDVSFDVADFTGAGPLISTPVVFRGRTARDITQLKAGADAMPAITRQFSRTERLLVRFEAYGPGGTTPKIAARLLNRMGESLAALPEPAATGAVHNLEVTLGALPPGDYLVEVTAEAADTTSRKLIGIRVTG
jgi:VWFA-related protein